MYKQMFEKNYWQRKYISLQLNHEGDKYEERYW